MCINTCTELHLHLVLWMGGVVLRMDNAHIALYFQSLTRYCWDGSPVGVQLFSYEGEVCFTSTTFYLLNSLFDFKIRCERYVLSLCYVYSTVRKLKVIDEVLSSLSEVLIESKLVNHTLAVVWLSPAHFTARDLCVRCEVISCGLTSVLLFVCPILSCRHASRIDEWHLGGQAELPACVSATRPTRSAGQLTPHWCGWCTPDQRNGTQNDRRTDRSYVHQ